MKRLGIELVCQASLDDYELVYDLMVHMMEGGKKMEVIGRRQGGSNTKTDTRDRHQGRERSDRHTPMPAWP